jgi:hypothetical protein
MAPAIPKKLAKKSATKPPDKAATKKGLKAPFGKPRKASAQKVKPESWIEECWQEDCLRRRLSTAERRPAGGGASEGDDDVSCAAEGRVSRVCHYDRRETMELFDEREHTGSGVPVDPRFFRRGRTVEA